MQIVNALLHSMYLTAKPGSDESKLSPLLIVKLVTQMI